MEILQCILKNLYILEAKMYPLYVLVNFFSYKLFYFLLKVLFLKVWVLYFCCFLLEKIKAYENIQNYIESDNWDLAEVTWWFFSRMQLEEVTADITTLSYWLNWRVLLCAVWVLMPMVIASFMIWKYESLDHLKSDRGETQQDIKQIPHYCKAWRPCLKEVHPIWLLAFRLFAFCLLLGTLIVKVVVNGAVIFYYYTQ